MYFPNPSGACHKVWLLEAVALEGGKHTTIVRLSGRTFWVLKGRADKISNISKPTDSEQNSSILSLTAITIQYVLTHMYVSPVLIPPYFNNRCFLDTSLHHDNHFVILRACLIYQDDHFQSHTVSLFS